MYLSLKTIHVHHMDNVYLDHAA